MGSIAQWLPGDRAIDCRSIGRVFDSRWALFEHMVGIPLLLLQEMLTEICVRTVTDLNFATARGAACLTMSLCAVAHVRRTGDLLRTDFRAVFAQMHNHNSQTD